MSRNNSELAELLTKAIGLLDKQDADLGHTPLTVLGRYCPSGISLRTGRDIRRGGRWFYLKMPSGYPKPKVGHWSCPEDDDRWWASGWAETEKEALLEGLILLMRVLQGVEQVPWGPEHPDYDEMGQ